LNIIKKQNLSFYLGAFIIFILSALFHYLYDFTDIFIFSFFSAINESVFEHIKITYFAAIFYSFYLYYYVFDKNKSVISGTFFGLIFIYIFIPTVFYGYTNILGTHKVIIDLLITFFSGVGFLTIVYIFVNNGYFKKQYCIFIYALLALTIFTSAFTFYPPSFKLFF